MAEVVLTKVHFDKLREKIIERTKEFATKNGFIRKAIPKLSKRNGKILHILKKNGFGCQMTSVTNVMSALMGFDFSKHASEKAGTIDHWPKLAAVVPLVSQTGAHNYPLDKVSVLISNQYAIKPDAKEGNCLPAHSQVYLRPATEEEIAGITDEHLKGVASKTALVFI